MRLAQQWLPRWSARATGKVSWLELFFDLIFVAAVSQVASPLDHHYDPAGLLRFATLFVLIWWAWIGHTLFSTRFEADDAVQRVLTLVQMFVVAAMAANATEALGSRSSAGFAAAYAVMRLVLVVQYYRARMVPGARALATRYFAGHGAAAMLWLASAFVPAPARFGIWALALAIDLGTPWVAVRHASDVPPHEEHLPERFGLFTLILLGESVVAVMHGMEHHEHWTPRAAVAAFLGMAIAFLIWWWYFDGARGAAAQRVRTREDSVRFHVWSYAHLPLSVSIVAASVGVQRAITADQASPLAALDALMLSASVCGAMIALTAIGLTSGAGHRLTRSQVGLHLGIAGLTLLAGIVGLLPATAIVVLAALCVTQLAVAAISPPRRVHAPAHARADRAALIRT